MKKALLVLLVLIALFAAALHLASGPLLTLLSERAIDQLLASVRSERLQFSRPQFRGVRYRFPGAVSWEGVSAEAAFVRQGPDPAERIFVAIEEVTVSLESLAERAVLVSLDGLSAAVSGADDAPGKSRLRLRGGDLKIVYVLYGFGIAELRSQLVELAGELKRLATEGVTGIPLAFSASWLFEIRGTPHSARFSVERGGDGYRLVMDREDLARIAARLPGMKPNPAELALIARHPLKAPFLLEIRDRAETVSATAARRDPAVPEDAYRHVLWSYLLAARFGDAFAKELADAHEAYADEEELRRKNGVGFEIASHQDLVNNAVGRRYRALGYAESTLLERVLADPAVIRDHEAARRFDAAAYEKLKPAPFR